CARGRRHGAVLFAGVFCGPRVHLELPRHRICARGVRLQPARRARGRAAGFPVVLDWPERTRDGGCCVLRDVTGLASRRRAGGRSRHLDLITLDDEADRDEVVYAKWRISENTGRPVRSFAAPFGRTTAAVRTEIGRHTGTSAGWPIWRAVAQGY